MDCRTIRARKTDRIKVPEFVLLIGGGEIGQGSRTDQRAPRRQKWQFEGLDFGKPTGRRRSPDNVSRAVARLIEQRRGRPAKLHRGEYIDVQPAAGFGLDFPRPGQKEFIVDAGYRRKRVVQLERYWRRIRARNAHNRGSDGGSDRRG